MIFDTSIKIPVSDISHHQGYPPNFAVVDFRKMKRWGFWGCIMRASHGPTKDNAFVYNWPACKGIMPRSLYHYYENWAEPKLQADKFWSMFEHDPEGMYWLDLEDRLLGNYYSWDDWYQWIERLKFRSGCSYDDIGIYSSRSYILENFRFMTTAVRLYFAQFKFWFADYGAKGSDPLIPDLASKRPPYPYSENNKTVLVQTGTPVIGFSAGAYSQEMDYNLANGLEAFKTIFKIKQMPNLLNIAISR